MTDDLYRHYKDKTMTWTDVSRAMGLDLLDGHRWLDTHLRTDPSTHYMRDVVCECCSTVLGQEDAYEEVEARTDEERLWSRNMHNWIGPILNVMTFPSWERLMEPQRRRPALDDVHVWHEVVGQEGKEDT